MKIHLASSALSAEEERHLREELSANLTLENSSDLFFLRYTSPTKTLALHRRGDKVGLAVHFAESAEAYRRQKLSAKTDLLARALRIGDHPKVCDLTLGLAQDAFKLAYLGAQVTGTERHPLIYALIQNALWRDTDTAGVANLTAHLIGHDEFLKNKNSKFDVYYLDPMFNHARKALPKKDMQYLGELVTESDEMALGRTLQVLIDQGHKVVVKRAVQSDPLAQLKPAHSLVGKMVRFDVY